MKYELYHHGILGMHWGIRRFQNEDGSLTPAGQKRYERLSEMERKADVKNIRDSNRGKVNQKHLQRKEEISNKIKELIKNAPLDQKLFRHLNDGEKYILASKKGLYDLTFVDITQSYDWSDKKALSEYKKYLDDPNKYIENLR
jgi:hypothetical protein